MVERPLRFRSCLLPGIVTHEWTNIPIIFHEIVHDHPSRRSRSLFAIVCNFSARRDEARRSSRPLEGFWALSRINIRECVQTRRVGRARWKAVGETYWVRRERRGGASERQTEGEGERTRWEHVSHTEIVNYSFVLR